MQHWDFIWDLDNDGIKLDDELDTDRLGWQNGDVFEFVIKDGKKKLVRIDQFEPLVKGYNSSEDKSWH
jgi:hypothetical protein